MLRIGGVTILLFGLALSASGQTEQGSWEFSLSSNLGLVSRSSEYSSPYGSSQSEGEPEGFLTLALRPGYYLADGLAFEPEFLWTAIEGIPPSFSLSGNLAYNFRIEGSRATPFVLLGYGLGNAIPIFQRVAVRTSDQWNIPVVNAGAGVKFFATEQVAVRLEYRFQRYSQEESSGSGSWKSSTQFHNIFMGIALFLPS